MATIALAVWPLPGVLNGVLALARHLDRRGHRVCIVSIPDGAAAAAQASVPFESVLGDMFPPGFLLGLRKRFAELGPFALLREMRRTTRQYETLIDALLSGTNRQLDETMDRIAPDLVLVGSDVPHMAILGLVAARRGIPFAYVTSLFSHYAGPANPPLSSRHVPRPGALGRTWVRLLWARQRIVGRLRHAAVTAIGMDIDIFRILRPLARETGYGWPDWHSFLSPMVMAPEFLLSAAELDFPQPMPPGRHRLGFIEDSERNEAPFPWERLDLTRKLLFCSLGTLLYLPLKRQRTLLQAMIDAAAGRPEWQLVMATGSYVLPDELTVRDPSAIVLERVPQLRILERAGLMITHAGVNSVHECVYFGVPMVALPIAFDQPGCAARVVHHGLGVIGDARKADADDIGGLIEAAADPRFAQRCAAKSAEIRRHDRFEPGLQVLESLAGRA